MNDLPTFYGTEKHPIIFKGWSIRRILAGEKTHTRRIVKPQPPDDVRSVMWDDMGGDWIGTVGSRNDPILWNEKCPYGKPGDQLWVKEAFRLPERHDDQYTPKEYVSRSGYTQGIPGYARYEADEKRVFEVAGNPGAPSFKWGRLRPAIHMPRELCRLRLRVEDVRVERLHEISNEEAVAEGVRGFWCDEIQGYDIPDVAVVDGPPRRAFAYVWEDIHGNDAWEKNPFVWVVEFSRINNDN